MAPVDDGNRARILRYVETHPGAHVSAVGQALDIPWGTIIHHLRSLERRGILRCIRVGPRLHVATNGQLDEGRLYGPLLLPPMRDMLALLRRQGPSAAIELMRSLGLGRKTVRSQINALLDAGLVCSDRAYHPTYWLTPRGTKALMAVESHLRADAYVRDGREAR